MSKLIFEKVVQAGQINEGDNLVLSTGAGVISVSARKILNKGVTHCGNGEEVIYNRSKNHYFITSMVIDDSSWVKEVYVIRKGDL